MRPSKRVFDELREVSLTRAYTCQTPGSVLIEFGLTKVLCTASIIEGVPRFLREKKPAQGWVTAEYGMLPGASKERINRESVRGRQTGRTLEIQRLIGRSLRSMVKLTDLPDLTITIDCDVLQADGGTRTASITGACVALVDAIYFLKEEKRIKSNPIKSLIASVSVGIYQGKPVLDLDYAEDSQADTDMNIVMNDQEQFIEVQGTAEKEVFSKQELDHLLALGQKGIAELIQKQKASLGPSLF